MVPPPPSRRARRGGIPQARHFRAEAYLAAQVPEQRSVFRRHRLEIDDFRSRDQDAPDAGGVGLDGPDPAGVQEPEPFQAVSDASPVDLLQGRSSFSDVATMIFPQISKGTPWLRQKSTSRR
jgi:hypothetical protein